MTTRLLAITTTSDNRDELQRLAKHLVEQRLAACCQLSGPIESVYRWEGKLESSQEWTCVVKTTSSLYPEVESEILELHHYDQPQIVATELPLASAGYLAWVESMVKSPE